MWDDQSFDTNSLSVESWLFAGAVLVAALWRTYVVGAEQRCNEVVTDNLISKIE